MYCFTQQSCYIFDKKQLKKIKRKTYKEQMFSIALMCFHYCILLKNKILT